jgi:hypothetical protein
MTRLDISAVTRAERELQEKLAVIERQQQVIRALSTPIIEVWDKSAPRFAWELRTADERATRRAPLRPAHIAVPPRAEACYKSPS